MILHAAYELCSVFTTYSLEMPIKTLLSSQHLGFVIYIFGDLKMKIMTSELFF